MLMVLRGWRSVSFTYIMRFLEGKKLPFSSMKLYLHFFYLNLLYIYLYFFYSLFPLSQFRFCSPWRLLLTFSFLQRSLRPWHHVLFSEVSWQRSCKLQSIFCPRRRSIYCQSLLTVLITSKIFLRLKCNSHGLTTYLRLPLSLIIPRLPAASSSLRRVVKSRA